MPATIKGKANNSRQFHFLQPGTRKSFVVLPQAVALPSGWETTVVVIVFQSLVELFGMDFNLWWMPNKLLVR